MGLANGQGSPKAKGVDEFVLGIQSLKRCMSLSIEEALALANSAWKIKQKAGDGHNIAPLVGDLSQ